MEEWKGTHQFQREHSRYNSERSETKRMRRRHRRGACTRSVILEPEWVVKWVEGRQKMNVHLSLLGAVGVVSAVREVVRCGMRVVTHRQWQKTEIEDIITVYRDAGWTVPWLERKPVPGPSTLRQ